MKDFISESTEIYKALQEHFPDGVDFVIVPSLQITEATVEPLDMSALLGMPPEEAANLPPPVTKRQFNLNEIEPETGIYAAMSPATHRVYVYIDPFVREFYGA